MSPSASALRLLSAGVALQDGTARQRILDSCYDLFSRHGIRAVGIDAIIEHSGVARMTLYRHFTSKEQLVLEFLQMRESQWTIGWVQAEAERRAPAGRERLLALFDVFHEWFQRDDFEGCAFINVMLESERGGNVRQASIVHLDKIRELLKRLAADAGVIDTAAFAHKWHMLMKGSIVAAGEGDRQAALRAKELGELLIAAAVPAGN